MSYLGDNAGQIAPPPLVDGCALFLDVDGCLLEFEDDPSRVRAGPSLLRCLEAVSHRLSGALALVSGRSVEALDAIFAPMEFPAAGLHGQERRLEGQETQRQASLDHPELAGVVADARALSSRYPRAIVEDKGSGLALHWRGAPDAEGAMRAFAARALGRLPGYVLQDGSQVLELRPEGEDKGTAIAAFLEQSPFAGRLPVFIGDDLTDEHGFDVVNARGGNSVIVGNRMPTNANYRLATPADVRRWLELAT